MSSTLTAVQKRDETDQTRERKQAGLVRTRHQHAVNSVQLMECAISQRQIRLFFNIAPKQAWLTKVTSQNSLCEAKLSTLVAILWVQ
jgi:hypothetical protein